MRVSVSVCVGGKQKRKIREGLERQRVEGRVGGKRDKEEIREGRGTKGDVKGRNNTGDRQDQDKTRQDKTRGSGLRRNMAEPELKQRSSRESVAKEKMEGTYRARSLSCGHHMAQGCVNLPCAGYDATLPDVKVQLDLSYAQIIE